MRAPTPSDSLRPVDHRGASQASDPAEYDATAAAPSAPSSSSSSPRPRVLEWVAGLPSDSELTPVSHLLITPALAAAFRIDIAGGALLDEDDDDSPPSNLSFGCDEEVEGETKDTGSGRERRRRAAEKKPRMVWTPELHHRFLQAVAHLGEKRAVPKAIVHHMNVEGLTRQNVASHLQKYRIYLKRTRSDCDKRERDQAAMHQVVPRI